MTPPSDPPEPSTPAAAGADARDQLVDLLASCALDGVDADPSDLTAAEAAGVTEADIEHRRAGFAELREGLLEPVADPAPDALDEISERRRERAILAAVTASARPAKQRLGATPTTSELQRRDQRRLAPILVAAGVLAIAGLGALVISGGGDSEDTASSSAEAQLGAVEDGAPATTTSSPAASADASAPVPEGAFDTSADEGARSEAPSPTVLDLGSLDSLNAAFDAVGGGGPTTGSGADVPADTRCVVQMAIEGYRAVASVRVGTTTHLVGEATTGELAAFRTSDCTVVARRSN